MKIHILDDWFDTLRTLSCFEKLHGHDVTIWNDHEPNPNALARRVSDAECLVLFREHTKIRSQLLDQLPKLRLISQRSVYPHIDIEACTRNSVLVCSNMHSDVPSYATAEFTLALILASFRQIPQQVASLQNGNWQMDVGRSLRGRTLGIYGYGRIGKAVSKYANVIGMNVQWWGSDKGRSNAQADSQTVPENRKVFFETSDIISLHVRLKPTTLGIITADDLASMSDRALLVNTSRSGLIAQGVLEAEILRGRIYAAVDVYEREPLTDTNHLLLNHPNVLATPHLGYVTEDEFELQFSDIFDQINACANDIPIHMINPEVFHLR